MPFLNKALLGYMTRVAAGFDVVMPRLGTMVEPLHAVYTKACLPPIEQMIKQGRLSVNRLLELIRVRYIDRDWINRFDPHLLSFFNINTEADLETARKLVGKGDIADDNC